RDGVHGGAGRVAHPPPVGFDRFDPRNVRIHGITEDRVLDAARFADVYDELAGFVGADVLAAHNAGFDVGVIESGLEVSGRDVPRLDFVCTLVLA
ncbi:DNA polymerase III subunit epsilon, partial [Micrococcus endophyticus]